MTQVSLPILWGSVRINPPEAGDTESRNCAGKRETYRRSHRSPAHLQRARGRSRGQTGRREAGSLPRGGVAPAVPLHVPFAPLQILRGLGVARSPVRHSRV